MKWIPWWHAPAMLRTVIVNRTDRTDEAFRAVLWKQRGPWLILRDSSLLRAGHDPAPLDGEILIHRERVAFLQVLPGG